MKRKVFLSACLTFVCAAWLTAAQKPSTLSVMTQNMDSGTDLGYALYGLTQPDPRPYIDLTFAEANASVPQARALVLALEIVARKPHLVALQEVTLWRIGPTPETATTVWIDQLKALTAVLGPLYKVVAVNTLSDVALPGTLGAVRYTDRDVLLARADVQLSDVQTHVYPVNLTLTPPGGGNAITILRGFISAVVRVDNMRVQVANTHLESTYPSIPAATAIQELQGGQLAAFFQGSSLPVVIAGDFNSDAIHGSQGAGPDNTETANLMVRDYGYTDSWAAANPDSPGPTWPLYLEDQQPPAFFFKPATPFERIDLIFSKGLAVVKSSRVEAGTLPPVAASDHIGVLSTFRIVQ